MKHYLLYGYGGACNHGSEASAKSEIAFLRRISPGCHITLSSHFPDYDKRFGVEADEIIGRNMREQSYEGVYAETIQRITPDTICLSVGGDIYCYPNWQRYAAIHYAALKKGAKSYLWRCSLEPAMLDNEMLKVISSHHLIAARESTTLQILNERGINHTILAPDMAFALPAGSAQRPPAPYVALNLSPLILKRAPAALDAYQRLIDEILKKTKWNIALVPHVEIAVDNDMDALSKLNGPQDRIFQIQTGLTAEQYKCIISKAEICVTARTHVAIAAWSTSVPTVVIAYSVKARGIAADLDQDEFVVDAQNLEADSMSDAFWKLYDKKAQAYEKLSKKMETYVTRLNGSEVLAALYGNF